MDYFFNQELFDITEGYFTKPLLIFYHYIKDEIGFTIGILPWVIIPPILFFCFRYVLISMFRLCGAYGGSVQYLPQQFAVETVQYFNPFLFSLHPSSTNYAGVESFISSTVDCYVLPIWGVPIYKFCMFLRENNWSVLKRSICDGTLQNMCLSSSHYFILKAGKGLKQEFRPHNLDGKMIESQSSPRLLYPFVLLMVTKEFPTDPNNTHLVLLANVVHISDEVVKIPTQVLHKFTKNMVGTVAMIKTIYSDSFEVSRIGKRTVELCIICMHREISIVIIPCGHACVCQACFELCENCPICRGPKNFYFVSCKVSQH